MPDYRLIREKPDLFEEPKPPPLLDKPEKLVKPQLQIDFKIENGLENGPLAKLPMPTISYEWSDHSGSLSNGLPTYIPGIGRENYGLLMLWLSPHSLLKVKISAHQPKFFANKCLISIHWIVKNENI